MMNNDFIIYDRNYLLFFFFFFFDCMRYISEQNGNSIFD